MSTIKNHKEYLAYNASFTLDRQNKNFLNF